MGMYFYIVGVAPEEASLLEKSPTLVEAAFDGAFRATMEGRPAPNVAYLGKQWHLLHFLFTGRSWKRWPLLQLLFGGLGWTAGDFPEDGLFAGREVGINSGYGRARLLSIKETARFAAFLQGIALEQLLARIDFAVLRTQRIYVYGALAGSADDRREVEGEVMHAFPLLRSFVSEQAGRGHALLMKIV
jgi:hypothetical protein